MEQNYSVELKDKVCEAILINLYTLGKEKQKLRLDGFDSTNYSHRAVFELCRVYKDIVGNKVLIQSKLKDRKYVKKKGFSWCWLPAGSSIHTFDQIIDFAEEEFKAPDITAAIYTEYYSKGWKE